MNNAELMSITTWIAGWGAITGTISVVFQIRSWWRDKARISLVYDRMLSNQEITLIATNNGNRAVVLIQYGFDTVMINADQASHSVHKEGFYKINPHQEVAPGGSWQGKILMREYTYWQGIEPVNMGLWVKDSHGHKHYLETGWKAKIKRRRYQKLHKVSVPKRNG